MVRPHSTSPSRRITNVTLSGQLLEEAKSLDLNISHACEQGLRSAIASIRAQQWFAENRFSFEAYSASMSKRMVFLSWIIGTSEGATLVYMVFSLKTDIS